MSNIRNWSTTPANNNATPPNGWPEGQAPSTVNDCARQMMADLRIQFNDAEWMDWGDTPSQASTTSFKIATDVTSRYTVNRRVKLYDASTLYGVITASSYSDPDTTVTVATDSGGSLTASLSSLAISVISPGNLSIPSTIGFKGATIASASTVDLSTATGDFVDISGTTTITAFGTIAAGVQRTVRFTGALTLTHNATSLILPSAANITTADGDTAIFRSLGSGNWQCISYQKASGGTVGGGSVTSVATDGLATGGPITSTGTVTVTAAVEDDMRSAVSTAVAVTPALIRYHPSVPKAFVRFNGTGTVAIVISYKVTSITDHATGTYTINYTDNITSASPFGMSTNTTGGNPGTAGFVAIETDDIAYVKINTVQIGGTSGNLYDPTIVSVTILGAV